VVEKTEIESKQKEHARLASMQAILKDVNAKIPISLLNELESQNHIVRKFGRRFFTESGRRFITQYCIEKTRNDKCMPSTFVQRMRAQSND